MSSPKLIRYCNERRDPKTCPWGLEKVILFLQKKENIKERKYSGLGQMKKMSWIISDIYNKRHVKIIYICIYMSLS